MSGVDSDIGMVVKYCRCCDVPIERCKYIETLFDIGAYEFIPDFTKEVVIPEWISSNLSEKLS